MSKQEMRRTSDDMIPKLKFHLMFPFLFILSITACSYNPFNGSDHLTGSALGTGVGAVAGGGTAAVMGVSSKPALALAALAGGSIGYYVTSLRFDSAGIIQGGGQVYTLGDYATIEIPSDRLFEVNSSDFLPEAEPILKSAVAVLNRYDCNNIMVSGNTSGFGSAHFEHRLSEDRAREVAGFLWSHGISGFKAQSLDMRKLTYVGYGNYFPVANNITNSGIRANSRIQVTAYPTKDQLLITKKQQAFNNVGEMGEPPVSTESSTTEVDAGFSTGTEKLSERPVSETEDFAGTFSEG